MLEKLSQEQKAQLKVIRDKWLSKIFNYELHDSITTESVVENMKKLYKFCGLKEPMVLLVDSPIACQIASKNQVKDQVWNQVGNQVKDQVENQVRGQVWNQVRNQVKGKVSSQVKNQVRDQVWNQVGDQVRGQVREQVENQVGNQVWNQVKIMEFTQFSSYINYSDFGWLSYYEFFLENTDILKNFSEQLNDVISFVNNSFMSIQLDGLCIVSKYPNFIARNSLNNLHSITRSAISFDDGYEQHYFNGAYVSPDLFSRLINKEVTFEDWSKEKNEETKSLILAFYEEKFGGEFVYRFLSDYLKEVDTYIDKKSEEYLVHTTGGMNIGVYTLFKGEVNDTNISYVRCYCPSTDRMFFLGVSPVLNNAKDAIASLCQVPVKLKDKLTSITRQGEIFSFNFTEEGIELLRNNKLSKSDFQNVVSLTGNEYFNKIKFEY